MAIRARMVGMAGLACAATTLLAGTALAAPARPAPRPAHGAGVVFAQTDNTKGNAVVVYDAKSDGTLVRSRTYPTGGRGGVLNGSVVDHLASQGSLTFDRARHLLYAVNAGSDTITVFGVRGDRLARRQVIGSGGDFPVSITAHDGLVYVLNARDGGSVQGFRWRGGTLARVRSWHRDLRLDTSQTPEFTSTPGQVAFSPDGRRLLVATKNGGNSVEVFRLSRSGRPSRAPVVNSLPGAVPFAMAFDHAGHLALTEAGPNAVATFTLGRDGRISPVARAATGQSATCWIAAYRNRLYAANAGSSSISGFVDRPGGLRSLGTTTTHEGTVDLAITNDGRYLYAQTGGKGVIDAFAVAANGSLRRVDAVTVPNAVGGEGIATF